MKSAQRVKNQVRRGFTLVELMVVVVIIGILAAIAIPQVKAYREKAQIAVAVSTGEQIRNGIAAYEAANPLQGYQGEIQSMSDVLGILQAAQVPLSSKSLSAILGGLRASAVPATIRCYFCVRDTASGVMVCTEVPCPVSCLAGDFQIDIPLMGIERTEDQRLYLRIHSIEGVAVGRLSDLD